MFPHAKRVPTIHYVGSGSLLAVLLVGGAVVYQPNLITSPYTGRKGVARGIGGKLAEESLRAVASTEVLEGFKPPLNLLKATGSMVYCVLAVIGGIERFEQDDDDAGWALMVAALAELTSTATYVVMAFTGAGAIVLVVAGAVAAVAYIVAEWLTDDPVARFLEHSEWGVAPYGDEDYSPPWLIAPIGEWPGDFSLQARHLVRVLARFTLRWDVEQWPGVTVSTNLRQPDTIIELRYEYRDDNGAALDMEKRIIRANDLRGSSPYSVAVTPKKYSPVQKNVAIVVEATYVAHNGAEPEELTAVLMAEGHGISSGKVDHVS